MSPSEYLLAGQVSELERLKLQSRVWEPSGRRLLEEIGNGRGARAVDIGCGVMGWLRVLIEWVGPDGQVVGTDIDDAMLAVADRFVAEESLGNVKLVRDDLFATSLEQVGDRAKAVCQRAGSRVDAQLQSAVIRAHDEISSLKKQMH